MKKFKDDFLLGAATAAHQVEGNNTKSDFWAQEQMAHSMLTEKSGRSLQSLPRGYYASGRGGAERLSLLLGMGEN